MKAINNNNKFKLALYLLNFWISCLIIIILLLLLLLLLLLFTGCHRLWRRRQFFDFKSQ